MNLDIVVWMTFFIKRSEKKMDKKLLEEVDQRLVRKKSEKR